MKEKTRKVTFKMPITEVKNAPYEFEVCVPDANGKPELIGTFLVRGASITWIDKNHSKKQYKLNIEYLHEAIKQHPKCKIVK
ncbi:MAG: hypothetical protein U0Y96_11410 [Candidatus Kapaibacterium sp.]